MGRHPYWAGLDRSVSGDSISVYGFAAGAMMYVVSDELIPEAICVAMAVSYNWIGGRHFLGILAIFIL